MSALVTAFLIVSASSQAQSATPPAAPAAPATPAVATAPEKKICRKEQEIGSIMPKRTCRTQAEWDAIDRATEADTDTQLRDYRSRRSY